MSEPHRTSLLICHERIAANVRVHEVRQEQAEQFCSLGAHAWCFECDYFVCDVHLHARHDKHHTQLRTEEQ